MVVVSVASRVPGVEDERRLVDDPVDIEGGVVGDENDAVGVAEAVVGQRDGLVGGSADIERRDVRVVVVDCGIPLLEFRDDVDGGRLAHVGDVRLVCGADHEHVGGGKRGAVVVELFDDSVDHVLGHLAVDRVCEVDEPRVDVVLVGLPGEIERVDWDAVAAQARARVERHETEGFRLGGLDGVPDVDIELVGDLCEFVDEADVDRAERVFEELNEFCFGRGVDADDLVEDGRVESFRAVATLGGDAAEDFRNVRRAVLLVARVDALGGEREIDVLADRGAVLGEDVCDGFLGGARINGALEDDRAVVGDDWSEAFGGVENVREIRRVGLPERRRNAY